jgi:hypothetical protein
VEYLLLHAFTAQDFIVPDKQYGKKRVVEPEDDEQNVQVKHFDKRIIVLLDGSVTFWFGSGSEDPNL